MTDPHRVPSLRRFARGLRNRLALLDLRGSTTEHWTRRAHDWVEHVRSPSASNDRWIAAIGTFVELVPPEASIVFDVGCGEGRVGRALTSPGRRVVGIDASYVMVAAAQAHPTRPVTGLVADAARLPFADEQADAVTLFMCLHDMDDAQGAMQEAARVARPGGRVVVALPSEVWTGALARGRRDGRYIDVERRAGTTMRYRGVHRSTSRYLEMAETAGLVVLEHRGERDHQHITLVLAKPPRGASD